MAALLITILVFSCKKKETDTPPPPDSGQPPVQLVPDMESRKAGMATISYSAAMDSTSYRTIG